MARIPFQKPKQIQWEILSDRYGRLVAEPFEKGYALTVGNSLRRTLLSIIPGSAVTWVRIKGVKDVTARIPGVQETTEDVLLNIKKLAVNVPSGESLQTQLEAKGPKEVTGPGSSRRAPFRSTPPTPRSSVCRTAWSRRDSGRSPTTKSSFSRCGPMAPSRPMKP